MKIDAHVHVGGERVGFQMNETMILEAMKTYHIDYVIVSNGDAVEADHQQNILPKEMQVTQEAALERVIRFARQNTGKIGVAAWVKPLHQQPTEELEKMIRENLDIVHAIKLHPVHSALSPIDKRVIPYLELAVKYHLPVISHTAASKEASVNYMYEAAKRYPSIPFIMAHMGLETDNKEALDTLGKTDNLYGDTAWVPMNSTIEAINRYGSKKMLFGSDMPIDGTDTYLCNPKGERSIYQDYFHVLPKRIEQEAYQDLMYANAVKVFRLKQFMK